MKMYCPNCGVQATDGANYCNTCGFKLNEGSNPQFASYDSGANFSRSEESLTKELFAAFVGAEANYYLNKWQEIDSAIARKKAPLNWNWFSFLFGPFWFAFRKMYLYAAIMLIGSIVVDEIAHELGWGRSLRGAQIGFTVFLGLYGNYIYYKYAKENVAKITKSIPNNVQLQKESLAAAGGTSWLGVGMAVVGTTILGILLEI